MKPSVLFVTDPLCSWCFATLPELDLARGQLAGEVTFDLIMGGLQVGTTEGLLEYDVRRLHRLWGEVTATTGQRFSYEIPENFVYHSELACRAVEVARSRFAEPPFDFFVRLQKAFYLEGQNINDVNVLAELLELDVGETQSQLVSEGIIEATRANFALAKSLSANALPNFMIDVGEGYRLLCGGYVTAEYLVPDIRARMNQTVG